MNFKVRNVLLFAQSTITIFSFFAKVPVGAWKLHFTWSEKLFTAVCFFWRRKPVLSFLDLYQKNLDFIVNIHQQRCKIYLLRVQKKQAKQVSFVYYVFSFHQKRGIWASENWPFGGSFSGMLLKHAFYLSRNIFWRKTMFWQTNFFQSNSGIWTWTCRPLRETFQRGQQNCFLHLDKIILKSVYRYKMSKQLNVCNIWA